MNNYSRKNRKIVRMTVKYCLAVEINLKLAVNNKVNKKAGML